MNKKCTKCKRELNLKFFYDHKHGKHGKVAKCSFCINEERRERYKNDKAFRETLKKSSQEYRDKQKVKR